jgi:hypothetical protein
MSVILCTEIPQLALLKQQSIEILIADNYRLLKTLLMETFPTKLFTICRYEIPRLIIYDIQFNDIES